MDDITPPDLSLEPLSAGARMYLGRLQPWGNPSYLAAEMGADVEPVSWQPSMLPAAFPCPCCTGTVTATAHLTMVGVMTLACDRGCSPADLEAQCRRRAPAAFVYRDDLMPPMPAAMVAAVEALLVGGAVDAATYSTLGLSDARTIVRVVHKMRAGASSTALYPITNEHGEAVALVLRANFSASEDSPTDKIIRQVHAYRTAHGTLEARLGLPAAPWPLVGLHLLAAEPNAPILVVEGEATREAALKYAPGYVAVTSLCGAENAHVSDWGAVNGRNVTVLGDNDDAGQQYARAAAARSLAAGAATVSVATLPAGLPAKWDLADGLPGDVPADAIRKAIADAASVTWEEVRHAMRRRRAQQEWPPFRLPDGYFRTRQPMREAIEAALERISSALRRRAWVRVLGGLHHMLGPDGLPMAVAWSKRGNDVHGKFREGEVEQLFAGFDADPYPTPMSAEDLFWLAWRESRDEGNGMAGWRPDADALTEAGLATFEASHRKFRSGDNIRVGKQTQHSDGTYEIEYLREETVKSEYKSIQVPGFNPSKRGGTSVFAVWETHQRIKPMRLVFRPGEEVGPGEFNMFQGLTIKPRRGGSYKLFRQLVDRITIENEVPGDYLWTLMAYRMQNLNTFVPTCLVMIGTQGSFKSKLSSVMYDLLRPHSETVSHADNLVGGNNGRLEDKLLVQSEEIELTSADQNNRLKNYITNPVIDYVDKYKQRWSGDNRTFIIMTSNARVPVRVPPDDRRFFLLRVRDPFEGDEEKRSDLHTRMEAELRAGGYEALMYDLLHTDLTGFNPRIMPKTPLSRELSGMDVEREPINSWWREHLELGAVRYGSGEVVAWNERVNKDRLYQQYVGWSESNGAAARAATMTKDAWARRLKELAGGHDIARRRTGEGGVREQVLELPDHETCCRAYERRFRCKVIRPNELPPSSGPVIP